MSDDHGWNHPVCDPCLLILRPNLARPARIVRAMRETERCCGCGEETTSGLYYRADPRRMRFCPDQPEG